MNLSIKEIRVLLIDDHVLVRDSLARLLEDEPDLACPQTAGDAGQGLELIAKAPFDVVVMDINMPGMNCFSAAKQLLSKHPKTTVVFLSAFWNDMFIEQATTAGACGMLSKSDPPETLIAAIRAVVDGGVYLSNEVRDRLKHDSLQRGDTADGQTKLSMLTQRETEILCAVGMGQARRDIAENMKISNNTVAVHTGRVMRKLDIHDRVSLARFAIKVGLSPL